MDKKIIKLVTPCTPRCYYEYWNAPFLLLAGTAFDYYYTTTTTRRDIQNDFQVFFVVFYYLKSSGTLVSTL